LVGEHVLEKEASGNLGLNVLTWDLKNFSGRSVASGLYLYSLEVDDGSEKVRKIGKIAIIR